VAYFVGARPAGQNYFNNTARPALQKACNGCHNSIGDYYYAKSLMMSPSIFNGGSATNNLLFLKATGAMNHGGGSLCSPQTAPCAQISQWWTAEFAP
jgi:hypothetical protein